MGVEGSWSRCLGGHFYCWGWKKAGLDVWVVTVYCWGWKKAGLVWVVTVFCWGWKKAGLVWVVTVFCWGWKKAGLDVWVVTSTVAGGRKLVSSGWSLSSAEGCPTL